MRLNRFGVLVLVLAVGAMLTGCLTKLNPAPQVPDVQPYNLVAGKTYTIPEGALQPYTNWPDAERVKLTDGNVLPAGINHNQPDFTQYIVGFFKSGAKGLEVNLVFDLEEIKQVEKVRFSAYSYHTTAYTYYYPDLVEVLGSTDGESWSVIASFENPVPRADQQNTAENGSRWFDIELTEPATVRYVRVNLITGEGTSYMFLDEIEIIGLDIEEEPLAG